MHLLASYHLLVSYFVFFFQSKILTKIDEFLLTIHFTKEKRRNEGEEKREREKKREMKRRKAEISL